MIPEYFSMSAAQSAVDPAPRISAKGRNLFRKNPLKGARTPDLPIQQSIKVELMIILRERAILEVMDDPIAENWIMRRSGTLGAVVQLRT
jgi:hypothetical protein